MTKDELAIIRKDMELRESEIEKEMSELSKEQHKIHSKMREYYQQYIEERFPYKVGDHLKYTFKNRDKDIVTREIEITEISGYRCRLNEIIIYYKWEGGTDRIDCINIDGEVRDLTHNGEKLERM